MRCIAALALCGLFVACGKTEQAPAVAVDAEFQKRLQEQLLDAKPGSVVEIPAGSYRLDRGLSLRVNGVTGPLSGGGSVGLVYKGSASGSSTNLILDITGYFAP